MLFRQCLANEQVSAVRIDGGVLRLHRDGIAVQNRVQVRGDLRGHVFRLLRDETRREHAVDDVLARVRAVVAVRRVAQLTEQRLIRKGRLPLVVAVLRRVFGLVVPHVHDNVLHPRHRFVFAVPDQHQVA